MPILWESPAWVKLHANCGGFVRWREAIEIMGVGYTGECLFCGTDRIPQEGIIPIRDTRDNGDRSLRDALEDLSLEERARLRWDDSRDHDRNQQRLRREILARSGVTA